MEETKVEETRKKKSALENKDRNNINISLKKRNKEQLNQILNNWVEEGYNLSSEICDAIMLKDMSNTNPHIQTILSTLSLIESSLKSHVATRNMKDEEINLKALSIFNEVITIDIDGNKLTNLIKGVYMNNYNSEKVQQPKESKQIEYVAPVTKEVQKVKETEIAPIKTTNLVEMEEPKVEIIKEKVVEEDNTNKITATLEVEKSNIVEDSISDDDMFNVYAVASGFQL